MRAIEDSTCMRGLVLCLLSFAVLPRAGNGQQVRLDVTRIAARVLPATVVVQTYDGQRRLIGYGSGFFVARDQVITNRHVIEGGAGATVHTEDGRTFPVTAVLAVGDGVDLARIEVRVPAAASPPTLPLASRSPAVGEPVVAVGNPAEQHWSVTEGIVSAFRERPGFGPVVQISADVWHGSSGGPVVNAAGEVIGVVVGSTAEQPPGINFAVRVEEVRRLRPAIRLSLAEWNRRRSAEVLAHATAVYRSISWEHVGDEPIPDNLRGESIDMIPRCPEAIPFLRHTGRWFLIARCMVFHRQYAGAVPYLRRALVDVYRRYAGLEEAALQSMMERAQEERPEDPFQAVLDRLRRAAGGPGSPERRQLVGRLSLRVELERIFYYLGRSYLAVERNPEAREVFEEALEFRRTPRAYAGLSIALARLGRVAQARDLIGDCQQLMEQLPARAEDCDPDRFW